MKTAAHLEMINFVITAHTAYAVEPKKAYRKWDGRTLYAVHPIWCAMTIAHETQLPEELRIVGAQALLLHDILEDTTAGFPGLVGSDDQTFWKAHSLVEEMTFASSDEEMEKIWSRSKEARLLKLYDKVSNLLDGAWMSEEKLTKYKRYVQRLADDVKANYGLLNIVRIAESFLV